MGNRAEHIRYKQQLKKGINLNLLVVGVNDLVSRSSRLGTSESNDSKTTDYFDSSEFSIETNTFEYSPGSIPIKLRVSVTNNFGFNCQQDDSHGDILLSYIENKHRSVLHEEMKINRNPNLQDFRIHLALYFVQPNIKGLSQFDIVMMSKICHRVNLLPVISKADGLTHEELVVCKKNILKDIMVNKIRIFQFLNNDENNDDGDEFMTLSSREYDYLNELDRVVPFAIIGSNTVGEGFGTITRITKWGSINIEDQNICDFKLLKNIIFESHLQEFKDVTIEKLYESFRIEQLLKT